MRRRCIKGLLVIALILMGLCILAGCSKDNDSKSGSDVADGGAVGNESSTTSDKSFLTYEHDPALRMPEAEETESGEDEVPDAAVHPDTVTYEEIEVSASSVNIRTKPSLDGEIVDNVKRGAILQRVEKGTEWDTIWYKEQLLYVYSAYVRAVEVDTSKTAD